MKTQSALQLNALTQEFYAHNANSFSATRNSAWKGWDTCIDLICKTAPAKTPLRVLDIGCGNLRFERFLHERLDRPIDYWGIDSSEDLTAHETKGRVQYLDIVDTLLMNRRLSEFIDAPDCNLVCAFGLMHHIPSQSARIAFLDAMLDKATPDGIVALSLWQFMKDERLARKALQVTERVLLEHPELELEENDWLLGWQESTDFLRYCHSFTEADSEALKEHVRGRAELIANFEADGKPGNLNRYLIFKT